MNFKETEAFIEKFIKENNLKDSDKNRSIIKMVLNRPSVQIMSNKEKSDFLRTKFLK